MKAEEFISNYKPEMTEYCPVVIAKNGDITECRQSHLNTLISMSGDSDIMEKIPADISPLLYLTGMLGCVIVDYESQVFMGELTGEQAQALESLEKAGLISNHRMKMTSESLHPNRQ